MPTTQENPTTSPIGRDTPRVDGPLKVTGKAQYTSDFHFPGHALRRAGRGDDRQRHASSSSTRPRPRRCPACARSFTARTSARSSARCRGRASKASCDERRPPFEDDVIRYYGQYVALAVADTFETAKAAADAVRVTYATEKPNVDTDLKADDEPDVVVTTFGPRNACKASAATPTARSPSAPVKLDQTYVTPAETHNPHRAARDDRGLGRPTADAVRVDAGRRQPARTCSRRCSACRRRTSASSRSSSARASAASCGRGRTARSPPRRRGNSASRSSSSSAAR